MNETNAEIERWQRVAMRLAVYLSCALPKDAVEFLDLQSEVTETLDTLTDAGLDVRLFGDPRMHALTGDDEALWLLSDIPKHVAHADVRH